MTRIEIDIHTRLSYLLDAFFLPTFMTSIVIFMPWHPGIIAGIVLALYGLSWFGHRYHAMLEAHAMVWFLRKSLEMFIPVQILSLGAESPGVIYDSHDFEEAWQKFYTQNRQE